MDKTRIFVANDDKVYLELMQELLEDEGYEVTVLKAAHNAYEEILADEPDLLVLDIMLEHPQVGFVLLDKLKLNPRTTKMPVIICSGDAKSLREREEHLQELGCFVLEKPFNIDELLAVVSGALSKSPSLGV